LPAVDYGTSLLVAKQGSSTAQGDGTDVSVAQKDFRVVSTPSLAPKIEVGKRIPSFKVLNQSDARPSHLQELLRSNGRWRVLTFPGDIRDAKQASRLKTLGEKLARPDSFLKRFTPSTPARARYDDVFEILAIHNAPRQEVTVFDFPEVWRPYDEVDGWDYWKIFVDDESYHEGHGQIYKNLEIDPEGCTVILRPDQHVAYVGPLDAYEELDTFFAGFMIPQNQSGAHGK
jgi:phenol 2-monooxygenase